MNRFSANGLAEMSVNLGTLITIGQQNHNSQVTPEFRGLMEEQILLPCYEISQAVELPETLAFLRRAKSILEVENLTFGSAHTTLCHLIDLMKSEMSKRVFLTLSPDHRIYFETEHHFGLEVTNAFPSASMDIDEAAKSLACGRNNAAVYHLMCVAEVGLRALAWDRRVTAKQYRKTIPLEFAQWGELIGKIEPKIEAIKQWRSKQTSAAAQQFYNAALVEIRSFNAGWRTHVMHARTHRYPEGEAVALFGHVRRFMVILAQRISESERTPNVWIATKS